MTNFEPNAASSGSIPMNAATRAYYSAGGGAPGLVVALTSSFILLYYSNVLGVSAGLVGAALAAALVFDAFWDPFVGNFSDNFHSRWGRRHPFMYAAILPVTLLLFAVWNPPRSLGPSDLALYLFVTIVPLRMCLALFDVPSAALTAELSSDYHERTRLVAYRISFSWVLITGISAALYGYWLRDTPAFPNGLLNPAGYREMGLVSAVLVFASMLICTLGLHPLISKLPKAGAKQKWRFSMLLASMSNAFTQPVLAPLLLASASISIGWSIYGALFAYQFGYFWNFSPSELSGSMIAWGVGVGLSLLMTPLLTRVPEKRTLALVGIAGMCLSVGLPAALGLLGMMPTSGGMLRYLMLCFFLLLDMLTMLAVAASLQSMLADAVEHQELIRGRREEGTIFAAQTLILKLSGALGVWVSGMLLELIKFPKNVVKPSVDTVRSLGVVWIAGNVGFYMIAFLALMLYKLTREGHEQNLATLRDREDKR